MSYLLYDDFIKTVRDKPNNIVVEHESGECFSYKELSSMSNFIGNKILCTQSKIPFVGILSYINAYSIASVLGTLQAGFAYVPFDDQSPVKRLDKIINNLNLAIIIIDEQFIEKFNLLLINQNLKHIFVISNKNITSKQNDRNYIYLNFNKIKSKQISPVPLFNQVSDDLAYILHSSGSTGVPKGIMLTHRNARTFVDWMQKEFQVSEQDVVMSRAPLKFDLSVFDIFNTLKVGAKLICYDWGIRREGMQKHIDYVKLLEKAAATFLYTTPSTFITLMNHGRLGTNLNKLRTIMYAGEPFPITQIKKLKQLQPSTKIANIYGPTETNIVTYFWVNEISEDCQTIPLGQVVDDTEILVVQPEEQKLCQPGEIGELWCRGGTVTLGYLGDPKKTNEHLVQSPFHPYPTYFWRSGDYGYRDINGCLHYKGRRDHMIKINGYRVELGEIETALSDIELLDEFCVVTTKVDTNKKIKLSCYYSTKTKSSIAKDIFIKHLQQKIPQYMIPEDFHFKLELPKTSSGKIDRVLLSTLVNTREKQ